MDDPESRVVDDVHRTAEAIGTMEIRGAATIADAAARALRAQAEASDADTPAGLRAELRAAARALHDTRPTAVSLPNALRYVLFDATGATVDDVRASVVTSVAEFCDRLENAQTDLGRVGANRLRDGDTIMTHCHSTDALACVEAAVEQGKELSAVVKETRPRMQGHITARALIEMGVDVTLVVDSAARRYMNDVDHVLVGADSIAADGSVVNKVGTSGLAVVARDRGTPVVCAAQTIKLHPDTLTGHTVDIEMRAESEVISEADAADIAGGDAAAASPGDDAADAAEGAAGDVGSDRARGDLTVANPAFDVTPPRYVDAIVTERGQYPPESVVTLMRDLFGEGTTEPWVEK